MTLWRSRAPEISHDRGQDSDLSRYLPALRAFFAKRARWEDVDDMVQDVMLRMQLRQSDCRIENIQGYLFQVAASVLADRGRRDQVRHRTAHGELTENDHPVEELSPERVLQGREQMNLLVNAIAELPERTRQAFVLHRFEEMTYTAIASHMGISTSGVEKHIMKAIRHLAERTSR